jgi:hypothetical protein
MAIVPAQCDEMFAVDVPTYLGFAIVSFLINPIFGAIAIICAVMAKSTQRKSNDVKGVRLYSDVAFGFAYVGIFVSVIVVVMVYANGHFPEHTYYNRTEVILKNS